MRTTIIAVALCVLAAPAVAQLPDVRVYVHTADDPSGFTSPEQKRRQDSTEDVRRALEKMDDKPFTITVVSSPEGANVDVEILDSSRQPTGEILTDSVRSPFGRLSTSKPVEAQMIAATLSVPGTEYRHDLVGINATTIRWRDCAYDLALKVRIWIKQNRAQLLQQAR